MREMWYLLKEFRFSVRRLRRSPTFSITGVLVLGVGIGAAIALFNLAYALFWRPLNVPEPDRLLTVLSRNARSGRTRAALLTGRDAAKLVDSAPTLSLVGLVTGSPPLAVNAGAELVDLAAASANSDYLRALSLQPLVGRLFLDEEDNGNNAEAHAVLLEKAWREHFHADSSIVGRALTYQMGPDIRPLRIVGVIRGTPTLPFTTQPAILLSIPWRSARVRDNFGDAFYRTVILPQHAAPLERVKTEIRLALANDESRSNTSKERWAEQVRTALSPPNERPFLLLFGAAFLLLLLMCANMASVFLVRGVARMQDFSIQLALGAPSHRLAVSHAVEAALLSSGGLVLGFAINIACRGWILKYVPESQSIGPELLKTGPVLLLFGIGLWVLVTVILAAPGAWMSRAGASSVLSRSGGRLTTDQRFGRRLIAVQLCIVVVLLTVGGVMYRSFLAALNTNPGFASARLVTFRVAIPASSNVILSRAAELVEVIGSLPNVRSVAYSAEPVVGSSFVTKMTPRSTFTPADPGIGFRMVGSRYFETLGCRLIEGRAFTEDETQRGDAKIVLNRSAARLLFGDVSALGRIVRTGFLGLSTTVIGVASDMRHDGLDKQEQPMAYLPYRPVFSDSLTFFVRAQDASDVAAALKPLVQHWDSRSVVREISDMDHVLAATVQSRLVLHLVVAGFALAGLIVSLVGIYGSLALQVERRTRELGLRIALGATPYGIVAAVTASTVRVWLTGVASGALLSVAACHAIRSLLYGIPPVDLYSLSLAVSLLVVASLCASMIPAVRAVRMNAATALRSD